MLKVRDSASLPKRDWVWKDPETGTSLKSPYYNVLMRRAKDYRRANNLPVGQNFNEEFEKILCEHNPDGCIDLEAPSPMAMASNLAMALANWTRSGFKMRSQEEIDSVMAICRGCNHYAGESGILKIVCKVCKCSRKKTALATEHCPIGKW